MKFMWHEALGLTECPYVYRWGVASNKFGSIRVHHWLDKDDDRYHHDHPWWFLTIVLKGGYTDDSPDGSDHVKAPTIRFRKATHKHTVFPDPGGAWTILITGPHKRDWGFWVWKQNGKPKFLKARRFFFEHGHHPCD